MMSPHYRRVHVRRIVREMQTPDDLSLIRGVFIAGFAAEDIQVSAAESVLFRLYSDEVAGQMAKDLGVSVNAMRTALDRAVCWAEAGLLPIHENKQEFIAPPVIG